MLVLCVVLIIRRLLIKILICYFGNYLIKGLWSDDFFYEFFFEVYYCFYFMINMVEIGDVILIIVLIIF